MEKRADRVGANCLGSLLILSVFTLVLGVLCRFRAFLCANFAALIIAGANICIFHASQYLNLLLFIHIFVV